MTLDVSHFLENVAAWGGREISVEAHLCEKTSPDGATRCQSWVFDGPAVRWARLAELTNHANGFRALSWAVFPRSEHRAPWVQAELIEVKRKLFLLVMDAHPARVDAPLLGPRCRDAMVALQREALPSVQERPEWAEGVISMQAVWTRPMRAESLGPAEDAFGALLAHSVPWFAEASRDETPTAKAAREGHYRLIRQRFLEFEPARPYMHRAFGEAWSEEYMASLLYPRLEEESRAAIKPDECGG